MCKNRMFVALTAMHKHFINMKSISMSTSAMQLACIKRRKGERWLIKREKRAFSLGAKP